MAESTAIDLTAEDVSQMTWDELTLLMQRKDRTDAAYDPHNEYIKASVQPPCTTNCCSFCVCSCANAEWGGDVTS
jgi:hypothetical protein